MKVDVYFNLHKKTLSVRHKGKVVAHSNTVVINSPKFVVSEAGRQRVLREKRKNVHALVRGELVSLESFSESTTVGHDLVTYNPYKYSTFVRKVDETPIKVAAEARISGRQIFAKIS